MASLRLIQVHSSRAAAVMNARLGEVRQVKASLSTYRQPFRNAEDGRGWRRGSIPCFGRRSGSGLTDFSMELLANLNGLAPKDPAAHEGREVTSS
jgi:hypothetical protein